MKGGQKPIHIMRWAAADFVNDPVVKLALARRDYASIVFYVLTLNWSHIEGGDVPADIEALAAVIGMPKKDVEKSLPFWMNPPIDKPKLFIEDTCLFNGRVRREVHEELTFRSEQTERGERGGRASARKRTLNRTLDRVVDDRSSQTPNTRSSPPAPIPLPLPAPSPLEADNEVRQVRAELDTAINAAMEATGKTYDEILFNESSTPNGKRIDNLPACTSVQWMRVVTRKVTTLRLEAQAKGRARVQSGHPNETSYERAVRLNKTGTDE